jgi:transposase
VVKQIRDRVAGLDVHRDTVVACCRVRDPDGDVELSKRSFATTRKGLAELAAFLADHAVETVAMEASGVYWKPVYYELEGLFGELWLCNAQHVKNVPGRKSDLSDAEWLADVAAHGMVRPSFVPPPEIRELRELTRYRKTQADARAKEIQRLEKVLQDAGVKLTSVASATWSVSSRAMVEALIAGERDPATLAQMAKGTMRKKISRLEEALAGRFGDHHAIVCRQIIDHIDFLDQSIAALNAETAARLVPFEAAVKIITSITGISQTTAEVIIAESGADMSRFPSAGHFCAWAGLAPASYESAGKRRPAGTRQGSPWLRRTLLEAARAAARSRNSYSNAQYARIAKRRGPNKAAVAVAHSMLEVVWHLLTTGALYQDPGADYFERWHDPAAEAKRLKRRIEALGYDVVLNQRAA